MSELKIAMAQLAPVWLNKNQTIEKAEQAIREAAQEKADLIVFGEGFLPGCLLYTSDAADD